jgi:hypothetical protein
VFVSAVPLNGAVLVSVNWGVFPLTTGGKLTFPFSAATTAAYALR